MDNYAIKYVRIENEDGAHIKTVEVPDGDGNVEKVLKEVARSLELESKNYSLMHTYVKADTAIYSLFRDPYEEDAPAFPVPTVPADAEVAEAESSESEPPLKKRLFLVATGENKPEPSSILYQSSIRSMTRCVQASASDALVVVLRFPLVKGVAAHHDLHIPGAWWHFLEDRTESELIILVMELKARLEEDSLLVNEKLLTEEKRMELSIYFG